MRKILLLLLMAPIFGYGQFGQGQQRYANGNATDQDGNTFEWINYGTQDWAIENAEVVTYRDGTPIPQVTDDGIWTDLTTGAWCYHNNDPTRGKLYNWYAVAGIHDNDENTPNKEFAPTGWHVPSITEWTTFENYLIANGYNYDGTTIGNKIGKSMASTKGWTLSDVGTGVPGDDQSTNNSSGFNAFPNGGRTYWDGSFASQGGNAFFWSNTVYEGNYVWCLYLGNRELGREDDPKRNGKSIRLVRDASTASTMDYSNTLTIYPNPTTSIVTLQGGKQYSIEVYDLLGNKVMETQGNNINMEHLSTATYIVKATDKSNNEELTYKVVKN